MNQSAQRTLQLLEYLAERGASSLSTISTDLGLNISTAHRFASALVQRGYARQDPLTRHYLLTTKVVNVSSQVLDRLEIRAEVRPFLEELSRLTSETAHLAILDLLEIVYIDKVDGRQAVQMSSRIGRRGLCHSTSLGKILLGAQPKEEWTRYVEEAGLAQRTKNTLSSPKRFYRELEQVRKQGHAIDDVENEEGIRCVGAPIRDHTGRVMAAMSISGWTVSMTADRARLLIPVVVGQATKASRSMGFTPPETPDDRENRP